MGDRENFAALDATLRSMPREQASGVAMLAKMSPSIAEDVDTRLRSSIGSEALLTVDMPEKAKDRANYANGTPPVAELLMKAVKEKNTVPVQLNPDLVKAVAAVSGMKEQDVAVELDKARLAGEQAKGGILGLFKSDDQKRAGQEVDKIYAALQEKMAKKMGEATSVAAKTQAKVDPLGSELTPKPDYRPKALDAEIGKKLLEELAPMRGAVKNGEAKIKAIMTLAQASPELAEDMLKDVRAVKKSAMDNILRGGPIPSQESLDNATKTFVAAAVSYTKKSGGANMEPVIDALATLKDANTPEARAELRRDIRTAAVAGAVVGAEQVKIDTGGPDNPNRADQERRRDEAKKVQAKSEAAASEDFSTTLLKMFVTLVAGIFGIDASKLFGSNEQETPAASVPAPAPAAVTPPAPAAATPPAPEATPLAPVVGADKPAPAAETPTVGGEGGGTARSVDIESAPKVMRRIGVAGSAPISAETLQKAILQKNSGADIGSRSDRPDGTAGEKTVATFYKEFRNQDAPARIDDLTLTQEELKNVQALAKQYDKEHPAKAVDKTQGKAGAAAPAERVHPHSKELQGYLAENGIDPKYVEAIGKATGRKPTDSPVTLAQFLDDESKVLNAYATKHNFGRGRPIRDGVTFRDKLADLGVNVSGLSPSYTEYVTPEKREKLALAEAKDFLERDEGFLSKLFVPTAMLVGDFQRENVPEYKNVGNKGELVVKLRGSGVSAQEAAEAVGLPEGYGDLKHPATLKKLAEMARDSGIKAENLIAVTGIGRPMDAPPQDIVVAHATRR